MSLFVYNNLYASPAQVALSKASREQGNVIKQLSTGLRINSASDDASGLAVADKLAGQISGLKRASLNTQDGLSYMQSVEGAMSQVSDMILRVRELSVQAGNGAYTANDRVILQLEVDQLKEEINRVSQSAEFNTKKLLDGDSTALWSSSNPNINAIVRGPDIGEGNYKIDVTGQTAGKNAIYKSDIMSVLPGVLVAEVIERVDTNLGSVRDPINLPTTGADGINIHVKTSALTAGTATTVDTYLQDDSTWAVTGINTVGDPNFSGYFELEMLTSGTVGSPPNSGVVSYKYRVMDAKTGEMSKWITASTTAGAAPMSATFTINLSSAFTATKTGVLTFNIDAAAVLTSGDKFLGSFSPPITAAYTWAANGGGVVQVSGATSVTPPIHYSSSNSLTKDNNGDDFDDYNEVPIYIMNLDSENGYTSVGSITLEFKEALGAGNKTLTGVSTVMIRDEGIATKDTKLRDIAGFTNVDGVNILELGQELSIYANGKQAKIFIGYEDTIEDLERKLNNAIVKDLGMGVPDTVPNADVINANLVKFVSRDDVDPGTDRAVEGTFVMQTGTFGRFSELAIIGDQDMLNALNLGVIQEPEGSLLDVKVTDAHTGELIGTERVGDGYLRGVIEGVDVILDDTIGFNAIWDPITNRVEYVKASGGETVFFHLVDNTTQIQVGANEGQLLNISVGQLDTTGLEIDDLYVVDLETSQRAITQANRALEKINKFKAVAGSQMSRLEYTLDNITNISMNLDTAEARIRDLDMAEASTRLARDQVLVQTATTMLAQANLIPQNALTLIRGG